MMKQLRKYINTTVLLFGYIFKTFLTQKHIIFLNQVDKSKLNQNNDIIQRKKLKIFFKNLTIILVSLSNTTCLYSYKTPAKKVLTNN